MKNASEDLSVKIKTDALRLLSFRPRSIEELRQRLRLKKYTAEAIEGVIETFTRQGLLNDALFARFFATSKIYTRPVGKRQLEIDLKKKGLSGPLIQETLGGLSDYDEKKTALDLARERFLRMADLSGEKKKARLFSFLKRRGFSNDSIFAAIRELLKNAEGLQD